MSLPFAKLIRRWSSAVAIAAGMGIGGVACGQMPQTFPAQTAAPMPTKYVVRNTVFHLPFKIGAAAQANAREMQLWMCDHSGQWKLADRVPPNAGHFTCRVPREGEYGFSIVTVDRRGVPAPRNVTQRRPELLVIVDMRQQTPPLPPAVPGHAPAMIAKTPPPVNPVNIETIVPFSPMSDIVNSPLRSMTETIVPATEPAPLPFAPERIPGIRQGTGMSIINEPAAPPAAMPVPAAPTRTIMVPESGIRDQGSGLRAQESGVRSQRVPARVPAAVVSEITDDAAEPEELPGVHTLSITDRTAKGPAILLVNDTHVSVEYNVGKSGPSGLGKVLIYGTSDQGQTWECLGEDADHHSPADITLPGEGTYGIRMCGINGNGFGGKAPAAGEQPGTTIEVDLTRPKVQSFKTGLAKNGQLEIRWKVTDKNLSTQCVNLFYRTSRKGAWKPLAAKLKSDGAFRWSMTQDPAAHYYFRLEAADMAGNVISCESQNPVLVDRTEPDINVTGVTVIQRTSPGAGHNLVPAGGETHDDDE